MKPKILITVKDGAVESITATTKDIEIYVADHDNYDAEGHLFGYYGTPADIIISDDVFKKKLQDLDTKFPEEGLMNIEDEPLNT